MTEDNNISKINSRSNLTTLVYEIKAGILKMKDNILDSLEQYDNILDNQIQSSLANLEDRNELIATFKTNDMTVRSLGDYLEQLSVRTLSLQAPVGHDLRLVLSSFRIIYDLQRISRDLLHSYEYLTHLRLEKITYLDNKIGIFRNCIKSTRELLEQFTVVYSMKSSERHSFDNTIIIEKTESLDDVIDEVFENQSKTIIKDANSLNLDVGLTHQLLAAIRSLERVGDHCCNVIERSIYIVSGEKVKIK